MVNQPVSLAVRVPSVRAMPGGDLIFHYSGGPLLENERNLQQPLEISSFQMITSRIFTSETWLPALLHSALPLCWPSRTGKWWTCGFKKKCQSNVNDDPIKKWFSFKLNNANFSDFAISSVSNFVSLSFFICSVSFGIFCNNFQFGGGVDFFF